MVLGMEWHQEWEPVPNWKKLEFTVETTQGTKRIRRLPGAPEFKKLEEIKHDLNLISENELEKELKGGKVIFCLYFARELEEDVAQLNTMNSSEENSEVAGLADLSKELQACWMNSGMYSGTSCQMDYLQDEALIMLSIREASNL